MEKNNIHPYADRVMQVAQRYANSITALEKLSYDTGDLFKTPEGREYLAAKAEFYGVSLRYTPVTVGTQFCVGDNKTITYKGNGQYSAPE